MPYPNMSGTLNEKAVLQHLADDVHDAVCYFRISCPNLNDLLPLLGYVHLLEYTYV
jgi:hypothetical protein